MKAALTEPQPRGATVAVLAGLAPLAAGMIWVILKGAGEPPWAGPWPLLPTMLALVVLGIVFSLADSGWARAGTKAIRVVISLHILFAAWRWLNASEPPIWVPFAVCGGTAIIVGATVAGALANSRSVSRHE
ncbi:hypothetical protein ACNI3K_01835 [Demequina sp. SO4-13]|uniref:hypothetical protein n=1 Tax=Demequina sp. SO4-13 TaxID=3401027 RepID=UPI003AF4E570